MLQLFDNENKTQLCQCLSVCELMEMWKLGQIVKICYGLTCDLFNISNDSAETRLDLPDFHSILGFT